MSKLILAKLGFHFMGEVSQFFVLNLDSSISSNLCFGFIDVKNLPNLITRKMWLKSDLTFLVPLPRLSLLCCGVKSNFTTDYCLILNEIACKVICWLPPHLHIPCHTYNTNLWWTNVNYFFMRQSTMFHFENVDYEPFNLFIHHPYKKQS